MLFKPTGRDDVSKLTTIVEKKLPLPKGLIEGAGQAVNSAGLIRASNLHLVLDIAYAGHHEGNSGYSTADILAMRNLQMKEVHQRINSLSPNLGERLGKQFAADERNIEQPTRLIQQAAEQAADITAQREVSTAPTA